MLKSKGITLVALLFLCGCANQNFRYSIDAQELNYTFYAPKTKIKDLTDNNSHTKGKEVDVKLFEIHASNLGNKEIKLAAAEIAEQEGYTKLIITRQISSRACETYYNVSYSDITRSSLVSPNTLCSNGSSLRFLIFNDYSLIKNGLLYASSEYERNRDYAWLYHDLYIPYYEEPSSSSSHDGVDTIISKNTLAYKKYYDVQTMRSEYLEELGSNGKNYGLFGLVDDKPYIYKIKKEIESTKTYGLVDAE